MGLQRVGPNWATNTYLTLSHQGSPHWEFSSVAQSYLTLCNPMNHSTPGLSVPHQLPEFTQTHVHRVSDAIQPPHPLSSPSPPDPIPPSIKVFSNETTLCMRWWPLYLLLRAGIPQKKWSSHHGQQESKMCTWMQSQKWQNDLCSFLRQTIQYHSYPSLCPNQ